MTWLDHKHGAFRAQCYFALRFYLHKQRWLLRLMQVLRAFRVLGPLRKPLVQYYQTFGHNDLLRTEGHPIFPEVDPEHIVTRLHASGYAHVGHLPEEYVTQILDYCAIHMQTRYWNPHTECEAVRRICRNAQLVDIARRYLGAEPILWLTLLKWSFPVADDRAGFHPAPPREPLLYDAHAFHHDNLDFKSLTLFIYLTDVDAESGAHLVIEGTHNNKKLTELTSMLLAEERAQEKFGERIKAIVGSKGTAFFEETSIYHKVEVCTSRRLILSIDYVLQRKAPPSKRPWDA